MCSTRVAVRWYKKGRGELYAYFAFYALAAVLLFAAMRLMLWLSISTIATATAVFFGYRWVQRSRAASTPPPKWPAVSSRFFTSRDGVKIHYQVMGAGRKPASGPPSKPVMVVANGLGGALFFWEPVVRHFIREGWIVVTWDYRGLFLSDMPLRQRRLAVPEHAEDVRELLDVLHVKSADAFVGWSTGVQVGLEFAALYPQRVEKLVLLNGTHGKVFQTAFQPWLRIPPVNDFLYFFIDTLITHIPLLSKVATFVWKHKRLLQLWLLPYGLVAGNPRLEEMTMMYLRDVFGTGPTHMYCYLRMFQELDAHSVFHILPSLEHPTLVISGLLDLLTPAYQSFEMTGRMPNAWHVCHIFGTHFLLCEHPEAVTREIADFVTGRVGKPLVRTGPATFGPAPTTTKAAPTVART